jgi:formate dehydrogenase iron-sulfur subunit
MSANEKPRGLLIDATRCTACRKCMKACMSLHEFEGDPQQVKELSATAYTVVTERKDGTNLRRMCRHCQKPSCASVCPVAALRKSDLGPVTYDQTRCIGCRYCMVACPFSVPRYEWDKAVPSVRKCDMCVGRMLEGKKPACAEACEYEATVAGTREELLVEARRRIAESPSDYYDHVYGETELGGTNVLFLTPKPIEDLFRPGLDGTEPLPALTARVLEKIPGIAVGGSAALLAFWWITRRRDEVAQWEVARAREAAAQAGKDAS